MQALMDRMALLASAASRTRQINALFGTQQTHEQIASAYAVEDIDLLLAWGSKKD
jgi:hypothetical protein